MNETQKPQKIKELTKRIQITNLHNDGIWSLIELSDKRIATGSSWEGTIIICSLDKETKLWSCDIKKENAHKGWISSLCELPENRLISCSDDFYIKIWNYQQYELFLLCDIKEHTDWVYKVINLPENRFASCSWDQTIQIWSSFPPYDQLATLKEKGSIECISFLKKNGNLISSCCNSLSFWNIEVYNKETMLEGICTGFRNGLVELSNGEIVASTVDYTIVIIDPIMFVVLQEIEDEESIGKSSSICLLGDNSFIYVNDGWICQIAFNREKYELIYKVKIEKELKGRGVVMIDNGNYMIADNSEKGFSLFDVAYEV